MKSSWPIYDQLFLSGVKNKIKLFNTFTDNPSFNLFKILHLPWSFTPAKFHLEFSWAQTAPAPSDLTIHSFFCTHCTPRLVFWLLFSHCLLNFQVSVHLKFRDLADMLLLPLGEDTEHERLTLSSFCGWWGYGGFYNIKLSKALFCYRDCPVCFYGVPEKYTKLLSSQS